MKAKLINAVSMTHEELVEYLSNYKAKGRFVSVEMMTEPKMNKGRGTNVNPYFGRVEKKSICRYKFNADYENAIRNKQIRLGVTPDFNSEPIKGKSWLVYNKIEKSLSDENTLYMRLYIVPQQKVSVTYYIDGRLATEDEITIIKQWLPKSSSSIKQLEHGIPIDEQLEIRSPKIENLIKIRMDKKEITVIHR